MLDSVAFLLFRHGAEAPCHAALQRNHFQSPGKVYAESLTGGGCKWKRCWAGKRKYFYLFLLAG